MSCHFQPLALSFMYIGMTTKLNIQKQQEMLIAALMFLYLIKSFWSSKMLDKHHLYGKPFTSHSPITPSPLPPPWANPDDCIIQDGY